MPQNTTTKQIKSKAIFRILTRKFTYLFTIIFTIVILALFFYWPHHYEKWEQQLPVPSESHKKISFHGFPTLNKHSAEDVANKMTVLTTLFTGLTVVFTLLNAVLLFRTLQNTQKSEKSLKKHQKGLQMQLNQLSENIKKTPLVTGFYDFLSQFAKERSKLNIISKGFFTATKHYYSSNVFTYLRNKFPDIKDQDDDFIKCINKNFPSILFMAELAYLICNQIKLIGIIDEATQETNKNMSKEIMKPYEDIFSRYLTDDERFIFGKIRHMQYNSKLDAPLTNVADRIFIYSSNGHDFYPRK